MSKAEVIKGMQQHRRFLLTAHVDPEGDSIGSQLAMGRLLEAMGKSVDYANDGPVPSCFSGLPGIERIKQQQPQSLKFDAVVTVDCPTLERTGQAARLVKGRPIVNIDHHVSNTYFGAYNWIDTAAAAAGEMVYDLFEELKIPIDPTTALYLYLSIMTDTGSFRFSNTTPRTHQIVAELLKHGIQPDQVYGMAYDASSVGARRLLADTLKTLTTDPTGTIAWMKVTRHMLKRHGTEPADTEEFVNYARAIRGIKVAMIFKETTKDSQVKVSFRSNAKTVNVNKVAEHFGGGGHMAASGCVVKGPIDRVVSQVVKYVKDVIRPSPISHQRRSPRR